MKVSVLGCGRWGSFLAYYINGLGHNTVLWGREASLTFDNLKHKRENEYLRLPDSIELTNSLDYAIDISDIIIISISAQGLRTLAAQLSKYNIDKKVFILCMKGLESHTGKRLTEVFKEEAGQDVKVSIWVGPGHVQDFVRGIPNCMVIDSEDINTTRWVVEHFTSDLIRFYYGNDIVGNEIGAAAKNVIGIAAGMLDGLNLTSLKGALMARGTREISRLITAMGGSEMTAYGLCHLGDYEATLFSEHSHNRRFGEAWVTDKNFNKLAEGVQTVKALMALAEKYAVDLPICDSIYRVLFEDQNPDYILKNMFLRSIKYEFF